TPLRALGGGRRAELTGRGRIDSAGGLATMSRAAGVSSARHGTFPRHAGARWVMVHVKRILYPTDFSSYSNQAYLHAVALAEVNNASLTILYVYAPTLGAASPERDPK